MKTGWLVITFAVLLTGCAHSGSSRRVSAEAPNDATVRALVDSVRSPANTFPRERAR